MSDQENQASKTNLIPPHGGYRKLKSFQLASLSHDWTVEFCRRFVDNRNQTNWNRNRTNLSDQSDQSDSSYQTYRWNRQADQMIQAARSGTQNIAEGSQASGTSKKTELKLVNVARASLEELLLDFQDFLRQRKMKLWKKDDAEALKARNFLKNLDLSDLSDSSDPQICLSDQTLSDAERFANLMICLIHQANFLLDRQLQTLEKDFLEQGGFTERLFNARSAFRSNQTNQTYQKTKQFLIVLFFLFGLFSFTSSAFAADRFWVGGTGNWSDDDNHWATVSGGAPANGNLPTSADNVFFDSEANHLGGDVAYIVTVDVAANCLDITFARSGDPSTGGLPTLTMSAAVRVYGNLSLVSGMTVTSPGGYAVQFGGASGSGTVTTNGVTMGCAVQFGYSGPGKAWTLVDSLTLSTWSIDFIAGTLDTANQTVTTVSFANSLNSLTRTLTLGSSTLNVSGNFDFSGSNQTLTANTATINMTGASKFFNGGGKVWGGTVNFTGGGTMNFFSGNAGSIANLTATGTASKTDRFQFPNYTTTITTSLTISGNSGTNRIFVNSSNSGESHTITNNGTFTVSNADFQDITGAGTASWDLSGITGNSGDAGGNSGITFTTEATQYWYENSGNWSDATKWFLATGGTGGAGRVPLPQDDVVIDAGSVSTTGRQIMYDMPRLGKNINWSGADINFTYTANVSHSIFGSLTLGSNATPIVATYSTSFENRSPATITSAGKTFTNQIIINAPGTSVTLADAFIDTRAADGSLTLTRGTFNANNQNVTVYAFESNNSNTRTLTMGSGLWTLSGTGNNYVWYISTTTGLTFNKDTANISITGSSSNEKNFVGGGLTYNTINFAATGTGGTQIYGANTAAFSFSPGVRVKFPSGVTQTVTGFSGNGTAGNLVYITSSTPGSPATLSKASGNVNVDYFSIQDSTATGGANWWAGTNSTLVSGNSGWVLGNSPGVFYSVGQTASDLKTGSPSVSIASGVATFSVAQVGNIGVGDRITYNTNVKAYISGKTSSTVWNVVTATGGRPADISNSTVVSILREYTSLSAAEAGATDANHLNTSDLVSGNYVLNFPCYYDTGADTTAVTISGYTTGVANYIKIYTPNNTTTEANVSQRHSGKWDDTKYRIEIGNASGIKISVPDAIIEGMQIRHTTGAMSGADKFSIELYLTSGTANIDVKNNILRGATRTSGGWLNGYGDYQSGAAIPGVSRISNNIVYGFDGAASQVGLCGTYVAMTYMSNNTVYRNYRGIQSYFVNQVIAKNNISYGNTDNYYGAINAASTNNLSGPTQTDAPGLNPQNAKTVIFADSANADFHLSPSDTSAKNMGADLSADANLPITTDIDGQGRLAASGGFDIGADEATTPVFYSVGQNTTDHKTGSPTVTIASGVATFSVAQTATNMGVGDKITYNVSSIMYISGKISETTWNVVTATGGTPANVSGQAVNSIAHAFASLSLAEAGASGASYLNTSNLVAGNYQLNFPCYYDTGADTTAVAINGWTTGVQNYIKIYTPNNTTTEVNVSQRHDGKWNSEKFRVEITNASTVFAIVEEFFRLDGIQIKMNSSGATWPIGARIETDNINSDILISNNIITANFAGLTNYGSGISMISANKSTVRIWNNIIYNFQGGSGGTDRGVYIASSGNAGDKRWYMSNNTIYGNESGVVVAGDIAITSAYVKNNISYNNTDNYFGTFDALSTNNLSGPTQTDAPGSNPQNAKTVIFANEPADDFHLSSTDLGARDAGANLYADANLAITDDIDGNLRPNGTNFDIGADEADNSSQKIKGTIKLKGQVKFK